MNEHVAAPLDVAAIRQDFPILETEALRQDARLSRQCRLGAKAAAGGRSHGRMRPITNIPMSIAGCIISPMPRPTPMRPRAKACAPSSTPAVIDEIIFTKSATEAINLVASSFGQRFINEGDEIVLSIMEHHANIVPWHFLRERKGAVLKWVDVDDEGNFSLEAFEKALTDKTKIVAITHMSNVLGTVTPIKEIVKIAHARGIPVLVDGAQGAVHLDVDVRDLDVDFYAITGHKLYGPTGVGALYGKEEWLEKLPPFLGGGEMINEVTHGPRDL